MATTHRALVGGKGAVEQQRSWWWAMAGVSLLVLLAGFSLVGQREESESHVFDLDGAALDEALAEDGAPLPQWHAAHETAAHILREELTDREEWKYVVIFDLGSSGSRAYIYTYRTRSGEMYPAPHPDGPPYHRYKKRPGISTCGPGEVAEYMRDMFDWIERVLEGEADLSHTPLLLYATAGLRLLPFETTERILGELREHVRTERSFLFVDEWARVITGSEEVVFGWIGVQHTLHLLPAWQPIIKRSSVAVLDMGGGSFQFAASIADLPHRPRVPPAFKYSATYGHHSYELYGHSYLGHGINEARFAFQNNLIEASPGKRSIPNPCLHKGFSLVHGEGADEITFKGTGDHDACSREVRKLFLKSECVYDRCSFNNVYHPRVGDNMDVIVTDNLARVVWVLDLPQFHLQPKTLAAAARAICEMSAEEAHERYHHKTIDRFPVYNYCFEATYGYELLTYGLNFDPSTNRISFWKELDEMDLTWTYGAAMFELHNSFP